MEWYADLARETPANATGVGEVEGYNALADFGGQVCERKHDVSQRTKESCQFGDVQTMPDQSEDTNL
jgi:hypothetical protein